MSDRIGLSIVLVLAFAWLWLWSEWWALQRENRRLNAELERLRGVISEHWLTEEDA